MTQKAATNTLAAMGGRPPQISQLHMRPNYSEAEWRQRTARPFPDATNPRLRHLFNKDKDSQGRPYCLNCRTHGHTLDQCKQLRRKRNAANSAERGKGKGGRGGNKRQRP